MAKYRAIRGYKLLMLCIIFCSSCSETRQPAGHKRSKEIKRGRKLPAQSGKPASEVRPETTPKSSDFPKDSNTMESNISNKPHIVFVIADDMGYNDVGYHGRRMGSIVDTPNIDALAYSGVRLENYYVQPSCTPTRASLMTGRYPIRLGLQLGNIDPPDPTCLPLKETTLPEKLRELGYVTHTVGKWHLGFSRPACLPTRRGFDSYFGIVVGYASHFNYKRKYAQALYNNETVEWGYSGVYSSELYTQRAVNIIKNHDPSLPMFLLLSHQAVHRPVEVTDSYLTGYEENYPALWHEIDKNKTGVIRKKYLGLVKSLDFSVAMVTDALKETGLWNNTVFIFTTDNGGKVDAGGNNWPLRGQKSTLWEGGIRGVGFVNSPLLPQRVVGTVQRGLMHVSDWFPTLIEGVAGGVAEGKLPLDGINMWPTISQARRSPRYEILHNIRSSMTTKHKYVALPPHLREHDQWGRPSELPFDPHIIAAIRFSRWKLITGYYGSKRTASWKPPPESNMQTIPVSLFDHDGFYIRLYNLENDPFEKVNVALLRRKLVRNLLSRLEFHMKNAVKPTRSKDMASQPVVRDPTDPGPAWRPWLS